MRNSIICDTIRTKPKHTPQNISRISRLGTVASHDWCLLPGCMLWEHKGSLVVFRASFNDAVTTSAKMTIATLSEKASANIIIAGKLKIHAYEGSLTRSKGP